jgi:hypothetical protein
LGDLLEIRIWVKKTIAEEWLRMTFSNDMKRFVGKENDA